MRLSARHGLFSEHRRSLWQVGLSFGLTVCVLLLNSHTNRTVSLVGAGVGLLLLSVEYFKGDKRIESTLTWIVSLVVLGLVGGAALNFDMATFIDVASRILCGVIWILWLGTQMDWVSLRQILLYLRVPESIVVSLDQAVMHGIFTQREWIQRRDSARLRLGVSTLPMGSWGQILSEGVLQAFVRLETVERNSRLRSAAANSAFMTQTLGIQNLSVVRGNNRVLEGVNLTVNAGEWVLLCGPSGAGKSSLLRLMAGLEEPETGALNRLGVPVSSGMSLSDRLDGRVAFLVQNPEHHFIASTVAEDIMWGLLQRDVDESEARSHCIKVATSLRIDHLLERPCHELSFGEQRRVALAGLLVLEPRLLLLDEPTSGLDPVSAFELRELVKEYIEQTGATCIWSTHDLHSVPSQAQRVVLLTKGQILFDGDCKEGLSKPWLIQAGLAISS